MIQPYEIQTRAPREMCAKELVTEYRQVRRLLKDAGRLAAWYASRLEDRATMLRERLAELFIEHWKEQENGR